MKGESEVEEGGKEGGREGREGGREGGRERRKGGREEQEGGREGGREASPHSERCHETHHILRRPRWALGKLAGVKVRRVVFLEAYIGAEKLSITASTPDVQSTHT